MSAQKVYTDDICLLQNLIVLVERTHGDVDTHLTDVRSAYPNGFSVFPSVTKKKTEEFIQTGVPPRGTALITWVDIPGVQAMPMEAGLVPEDILEVLDRSLALGDVVKKKAQDAMSGTVVEVHSQVHLSPPKPWKDRHGKALEPSVFTDPSDFIGPINSADLCWPAYFQAADIVRYKDWVGKVAEVSQEVSLRLSNGSVVVPEKEEDITPMHSTITYDVGDFVETKKANLRRGRWVFGAYNPNTKPEAIVVKIETTSMVVEWIGGGGENSGPPPPTDVGKDLLESGDIVSYDNQLRPPGSSQGPHKSQQENRASLDVRVGEVVEFHDLAAACTWYNSNGRLPRSSKKLTQIPRTETLGFNVNSFVVARKETTVVIQWQDLSKSVHKSREVIPTIDMDDDDDVWPGEIVCTRAKKDSDTANYTPKRTGVAQAINAKDRTAKVRWFEGSISCPSDDKSVLFPGSWTGTLKEESEDMSLYDIWTVPAITRRQGDYVMLANLHRLAPNGEGMKDKPCYKEIDGLFAELGTPTVFGQIISLGLDGALTVRVGVPQNPKDIKVPIECTYPLQLSDWEEGGDLDENATQEMLEQALDLLGHHDPSADWRDEEGHLVKLSPGEGDDPWEDEDDVIDGDADMQDAGRAEIPTAHDKVEKTAEGGTQMPDAPPELVVPEIPNTELSDHLSLPKSSFSYSDMFKDLPANERPQSMKVVEGPPPDDHYFRQEGSDMAPTRTLSRINNEIGILDRGLPDGVYIRTWDQAIYLLRVVILGPVDTPYEYAPIVVDIHLHSDWPQKPPSTFFHSWTDGSGPINPNLYEDGKICLSLLGTWPGEHKNQGWTPQSTLLQLVVSILGLVLVKEPYYNEAGFEVRNGTVEAKIPAALYSERTYFRSRSFIKHALDRPVQGFEDIISSIYGSSEKSVGLLVRAAWSAIAVLKRSERAVQSDRADMPGRKVSKGALIPLRREITGLLSHLDRNTAAALDKWISSDEVPRSGAFDELAIVTDK